ncbi:pyridoxal-phosphate dependent enzyme [Streptomyces niveus]|uniref:pyridoxal-phosphate dependent enzyme n=1 Tax=Streptomyces niveus TaxID=193462 RepID=UPI00316AD207
MCARTRRGTGLPRRTARPLTRLADRTSQSCGGVGGGPSLRQGRVVRLGLPAFKALGASWAVHRVLAERAASGEEPGPVTLVTATDGNHGRAVARTARLLGQRAHVFVPQGVHPRAVAVIAAERATVTEVAGAYDEAVRLAAEAAAARPVAVLVQDTAWAGYERVPGDGSSRAVPPSAPRSTSS